MIKKIVSLGIAVAIAASGFAQAPQQPKVLSLQEAVTFALSNNEDIKKGLLDEQSAQYKIKETKGSGLPQLNGTGQVNMYPSIPTQMLPGEIIGKPGTKVPVQFGTKFVTQGGLQVSQLLFSKSYFVGLEAAKSTEDLYRLRTQMSREDVIYNVSSSYYQLLQTKEQFNNLDANYRKLQQLEKLLTLQQKNDMVRKVDVNRITVNKTNLENQRQTLSANYERQKNVLKFFMGMPMEQEFEVADLPNALDTVVPHNEDAADVLAQRTDFRLLSKQKQLYGLNVKNIKAGYYPSLSATGSYLYQAQRNEFSFLSSGANYPWFNTAVVGLQLNVPLFDGFQKKYRIKQAEVEQQKLDQDLHKITQSTQMGLDNATKQIRTSQLAIQNQERNVTLAQEVYDTTNKLYKEGLSPLTDLLDAEVSLRESQTNLNNEKLKYKIAQLDYLKARGELTNLTK